MNTNLCNAVVDEDRARTGKIARLSLELRDTLNTRMEDGEPTESILAWLNAEEETQEVVNEYFGGRPVNAQNLSNWRQGGFLRWQRQSDLYAIVEETTADGFGLSHDSSLEEQGSHLCAVLLAELTLAVREVLPTLTDPMERFARIQEFLATLGKVRQQEYTSMRTMAHRERRARERANEIRSDVESQVHREQMNAILRSATPDGTDSFCTRRRPASSPSSPAPAAEPVSDPAEDEEAEVDSTEGGRQNDAPTVSPVEASSRSQPVDSSLIKANQGQAGVDSVKDGREGDGSSRRTGKGEQADDQGRRDRPDKGLSSLIKVWHEYTERKDSGNRVANVVESEVVR